MGFISSGIGAVSNAAGSLLGNAVGGISKGLTQTSGYQADIPAEVWQQQQELAKALQAQALGQGPNPAQAQYQQNLNQVAAEQAGAIASQKGISPALQARMIANQAGQAQVQGAGQAATLQAQQQLAAQQQQAALANQMATQALQAQGINAQTAQTNAGQVNQTSMGLLQGASAALSGGATKGNSAQGKYGGGPITMADALKAGGMVPGVAQVPGDSPQNDTVHAMLSPGEIVIPRSLAEDPERAKRFIEELNGGSGYGKVAAAKRKAKNA